MARSRVFVLFLVFGGIFQYSTADIYLHVPRGSNNRLLGENANRQNDKRVFDSQNNGKGGYNAPEKEHVKRTDWFEMKYYMSGAGKGKTILPIEWTNQHGCGHGDLNCNIVLQYLCQPTTVMETHRIMRNGKTENTPSYNKRYPNTYDLKEKLVRSNANKEGRVLNEQWEWYDKCSKRERNKGLFTADQTLKRDEGKYTRQNPNGNRYGYECPEERDYYPYWHPTDWVDIAVLANARRDCSFYRRESFNVKPKGECLERYSARTKKHPEIRFKHASKHNNADACKRNGGEWINFHNFLEILEGKTRQECKSLGHLWAIPYRSERLDQMTGEDPEQWKKCLVRLPRPDCYQAPETRPNHLGNGKGIEPMKYNWVVPHFPSGQEHRCVLRIRYNISTNDYNPRNTFASSNNRPEIISDDPDVKVGKNDKKIPLQLAIDTSQFGRTFQDRSHLFRIIPRKASFEDCVIHNLNVKGKRGNIVQVYPAVEYDFSPKKMEVKSSHCIHVQFAGSNRNPKGNDGEGRSQTDRSNLVSMKRPDVSYPLEDISGTLFDKATVIDAPNPDDLAQTKTGADIAVAMATAGYFKRASDIPNPFRVKGCKTLQNNEQLDCYPPSYNGLLLKLKPGQYYYLCSRNNNFTNRNQKASIRVTAE